MEVIGLSSKPSSCSSSTSANSPSNGPRLAIGERFSACGKFIITPSGQWKEIPPELVARGASSALPPAFAAVGPDGRPLKAVSSSLGPPPKGVTVSRSSSRSSTRSPQYGRRAGETSSPAANSTRSMGDLFARRSPSQQSARSVVQISKPATLNSAANLQRELSRKLKM